MLIGICGRTGSGKSTAAMHLVDELTFERHRFAGPLKSMLHCLGLNGAHTDGDLKEVPNPLLGGKTPRWAMQSLGTEWGRDLISPELWVNAWKATMPEGDVVADDIRFANEADAVRSLGGVVVRIDRPGLSEQDHLSERSRFEADIVILNNLSVEHLCSAIERLVVSAWPMRAKIFSHHSPPR